ncbi:facilitated trehalose transporter Tret1-like [Culicoides brevitarsis]|uniref:facilitated trehalose transporter Tret1-like n=1 Tax=Culicoides brevitarsis TaxID=469753 RepID=UPI00307BD73A
MNPAELNYQVVGTSDHNQKRNNMEPTKKWRQFMVGIIVNLSAAAVGTCLGWTAPVNPKLNDASLKDSPLDAVPTVDEASWIGSLVALGAVIGPLIGGPMANVVGRKWTLLFSSLLFAVPYATLIFAKTVLVICIARFIQGLGVGFVMCVVPMYMGEISSDEVRGAMGSFMQLFIVTGILYVYCVGPYVSYVALQWACLAIPVAFAVGFFFMPESPAYYIQKGNRESAVNSLVFLRGKSKEGVQDEMSIIQTSVEEALKNKGSVLDVFQNKACLKALIISGGLVSFQQLSGINAVLFYSTDIFIKASGGSGGGMDPSVSTILVGAVMVLSSGTTPLIVDRLGRKIILLFSAVGMAISLFFLGLFFLLDHNKAEIVSSISWLPVVSLIVFVFVYCVGFGSLPWAVLGEMFSPEVKSNASSIVATTCWILGFLVTKYFSALDEALGTHWSFWIFAIFCVVAFFFVTTIMFETKGLTLQQIQDRLNGI